MLAVGAEHAFGSGNFDQEQPIIQACRQPITRETEHANKIDRTSAAKMMTRTLQDVQYQKFLIRILTDNGASINCRDENGITPLFLAAQDSSPELVAALVNEYGADIFALKDSNETILFHAADHNRIEVARILLSKARAHAPMLVNFPDSLGKTPLRRAVTFNHGEMIDLLLINGANPAQSDYLGQTPLHICASHTNREALQRILGHVRNTNRDSLSSLLNMVDFAGSRSSEPFNSPSLTQITR